MARMKTIDGVLVEMTPQEEAAFVAAPIPRPTPEKVKAEAMRRILAICPEWKQRNLTAQAVILADKGRANWTAQDLAAWDAGKTIWDRIDAMRTASNALEAMDPIPTDYRDDRYWP
ncbi:hypothetical protein [Oricola sp.]|uniref:hypothetical protein n=1 Tax=Oricola sp. TaxID=1979950 RepID=UPI0025F323BB|nr:hypothetical protein [Oricola sp.]MCI5078691.1 hypothetical protein [Oricola sp.]